MIDFKNADLFLKSDTKKEILIEYSGGTITNSELHQNTFSLEESLCSEESLRFGACESSILKFTVHNTVIPFKNEWIDVSMILNGNTSEPFEIGHYKVYSDIPTADRKKRNVVAYDALYDILQAEVSDWYNDLLPEQTSTVTLREFRDSFFDYVGVEQQEITLVNDSMTVAKTIQPEQLSGKTVINCICEINGCFGHIGRDGKFKYVYIEQSIEGLYPSHDLYPSNDLFPIEPKSKLIGTGSYIPPVTYSDFVVKEITGLTIREEEGNIGCNVGEPSNVYVIQDNFIVYGKGTEELEEIGNNILSKIKDITYIPFSTKAKGNPCIEVGDPIRVSTREKRIETYVLQRTITGVKSQRDYYEATGEEEQREKINSISSSIIQLKGKTNKLTRTLEETRIEMADIEEGLISTISITASQIRTELEDTKEGLESSITQTAGQIRSEVSDVESGLESQISQTATQIRSEVSDSNKDLQSQITQNAGSITSEITRAKNAENQLSTRITQTDEKIRTDVAATYETIDVVEEKVNSAKTSSNEYTDTRLALYSTTTQMNSAIEQKADSITATVNSQITETKEYADTVASTAESNANKNTNNLLKSYSTTTQMNSAITAKANEINLSVNSKITETVNYVDDSLENYSTTTQMNAAIDLSQEGILSTVSTTYETKTDAESSYTALSSSINQTSERITAEVKRAKEAEEELSSSLTITAEKIESKVSEGEVSSVISQESGKISIKSNRLSISSTYFTLAEDGKITATEVELSGKITATSGYIGSKSNGFTITDNAFYNGKTSIESTSQGVYIGTDGISCGSYTDLWIPYGSGWQQVRKPSFQVTKEGKVYIGTGSLTLGSGDEDIIVIGEGVLELYEDITSKSYSYSVSLHNNQIVIRSGTSNSKQTCNYTESGITVEKGSSLKKFDILSDILSIARSDGKLGFFEETPVAQQSVSAISNPSTATTSTIATTVNDLITALKKYGLLS